MVQRFVKFRKVVPRGLACVGDKLAYGKIGLKICSPCRLTAKQIESARMVITRHCSRKGKLFIRIKACIPVTKKPLEVRMGGGKGAIELHVASVKAGAILFELDNIDMITASNALLKCVSKLPVDCKVVTRRFAYLN